MSKFNSQPDGQTVEALIPALRAFARILERDQERADDLVQDTLLRALAAFDSFTPGTRLKSWLFTIMRNAFYTSVKKRVREAPGLTECASLQGSTQPSQEWSSSSREVHEALARLPKQQREVVTLVAILGESYEDAAAICGCNIGTIKSRLNRARASLAADLAGGPFADLTRSRPLREDRFQ